MWKRQRKLIHKLTSPAASSKYEPLQEMESTQFMSDMLKQPQSHWPHCQRYGFVINLLELNLTVFIM